MKRGWLGVLATVGVLMAAGPGCSGARSEPQSPAAEARRRGPTSTDGEVIARWLLAEMLAP
ncbi:MAG: hypothetical protein EOO75_15950, partial [Myxococcales bacterium]